VTLDELRAALADLHRRKGVDRAKRARELSDEAMATLAAVGDEAVWLATRVATRRDVARELGVTEAAVGKAVRLHNKRRKALTEGTESDTAKRASRAKGA
jgi:hypothetical protein